MPCFTVQPIRVLLQILFILSCTAFDLTFSSNCPEYCECIENAEFRQIISCQVTPQLGVLPCQVRWHNLRLDVHTRTFDESLFSVCNYVEQLTLSANSKLVNITSRTFAGLKGLISLIGDQNGSIRNLGADFMEPTPSLRSIKLYRNRVRSLNKNSFGHCGQLQTLDITSNLIDRIENRAFINCVQLEHIRLGGNQLRIISQRMFDGLPSLKTLYLNGNSIADIEEKSFLATNRLLDLWINENKLQEIGEAMFAKLFALERLDLSRNKIAYIRSQAFSDLVNLKVLKLEGNPIGALDWAQLYPLAMLESLGDIQLNCVMETGRPPNRRVQDIFLRFTLCNNAKRPPRLPTTTTTTQNPASLQRSSPRIETKSDSLPLQRHLERLEDSGAIGEGGAVRPQNPPPASSGEIQFVPIIPVWIIILLCATSLAFLVTLFALIGYCKAQDKRLRNLKRRNRGTPLPLMLQTDECRYLATAI